MAWKHYTLTLTGSAQRLSSVLADPTVGGPQDYACRQVILCADPANTAVVYIGGGNPAVSSTSHAFSLDPTQASQNPVSIGPAADVAVKLSEIWAIGTANERLMIGILF